MSEPKIEKGKFSTIVFNVYQFVKKQIPEELTETEKDGVLLAILTQALAEANAEMICEDKEAIEKMLLIEEDFSLYNHATESLVNRIFHQIVEVVTEEENRLNAAANLYTGASGE